MSEERVVDTVAGQMAQAQELTEAAKAELMEEAAKERREMVKALQTSNRDAAVGQFLAGMHGLRFVNLTRRAGKGRVFAVNELERDLSWWLGKSVDANLLLRTHAAILELHGDMTPPASKADKAIKQAWNALVDTLPPVGHFHKEWAKLVDRSAESEWADERWTLLPGFEDRCKALYADAQAKGLKLDDDTDGAVVMEKGIRSLVRELLRDYAEYKRDLNLAKAAALEEKREVTQEEAQALAVKAEAQQTALKGILEDVKTAETPEQKAAKEQEALAAKKLLEDYRAQQKERLGAAEKLAKERKAAELAAEEAAKKAAKAEKKLTPKPETVDEGRNLPWQAMGENAAQEAAAKDLAEALYGIVAKSTEPEDVLLAMMAMAKSDCSNAFKDAWAAFMIVYQRKTAAA